jgi:hypothetical protein
MTIFFNNTHAHHLTIDVIVVGLGVGFGVVLAVEVGFDVDGGGDGVANESTQPSTRFEQSHLGDGQLFATKQLRRSGVSQL